MLDTLPRRLTTILVTIGCLFCGWSIACTVTAEPASATTPTPTPHPVNLSLKPVGQTGAYFDLTMDPGQSQQLQVELGNQGTAPMAARTYAADAYSITNGGFGAKDRNSTPSTTTTWVSYPTEVLNLAAGQASTRTLTITVPADAAPGQYLTSLILENDVPVKGSGSVSLNQVVRQAVAVSVRVPGPLNPSFHFGTATHKITANHSVIDVQIINTGNANVKPAGTLTIRNDSGKAISRAPITMGSLYAHDSTLIEATLASTLQAGKYTADITMTDPATKTTNAVDHLAFTVTEDVLDAAPAPPSKQLPRILNDAGNMAVPILIGVAILVILALAILFIVRARRARVRSESGADTSENQDGGRRGTK